MAYKDFTFADLKTRFHVSIQNTELFNEIKPIQPSAWLNESISRGRHSGLPNEKARSERIIAPVLLEVQVINNYQFVLFSGQNMSAQPETGLSGEVDFIIAKSLSDLILEAPIISILEAKREDMLTGLPQCFAQMIGAQAFNEMSDVKGKPVYGVITIGTEWQFFKLVDKTIYRDTRYYLLSDLPEILGVFQFILNEYTSTL